MKFFLLATLFLTAWPARAAVIASAQTGDWSNPTTWTGGVVPSSADAVTIQSGHGVLVNVTTAACGPLAVNGTLFFSRASSATLTLTAGDLTVNAGGALDMGRTGDEIPAAVKSTLVLARGATAGEYGLIVNNGGAFRVNGSPKTAATMAAQDILAGASSIFVQDAGLSGWAVGDEVTVGQVEKAAQNKTERRTITGLSGSAPLRVDLSAPLTYNHFPAAAARVANLTRNVLVRSSGTNVQADTAYIQNLTQPAANFTLINGEFAHLGSARSDRFGLGFEAVTARGALLNCTVRDGYIGVFLDGVRQNVLSSNLLYGHVLGAVVAGGGENLLSQNDVYGSLSGNISVFSSSANVFLGNFIYSGSNINEGAFFISGSTAEVVSQNAVYANVGTGLRLEGASRCVLASNNVFNNFLGGGLALFQSPDSGLIDNASSFNDAVGLLLDGSPRARMVGNRAFLNVQQGALLNLSPEATLSSNEFSSNATGLILVGSPRARVFANLVHSNAGDGVVAVEESHQGFFAANTVRFNVGYGIAVSDAQGLHFSSNTVHGNRGGILLSHTTGGLHVDDTVYGNTDFDFLADSAAGLVLADGRLGFDRAMTSLPSSSLIEYSNAGASDVVFRGVRLNPAGGVAAEGFQSSGARLASFNQSSDTGTVRLWGDAVLAGSTAVDNAQRLYRSTAAAPILLAGSGHAASVTFTDDASVVSQVITVSYDGANALWRVGGTVSGLLGTFTGSVVDRTFGAFRLTFTEGALPADQDQVIFGLLAASDDAGRRKRVLVGPAGPLFNGGRSRVTVPAGGAFALRGAPGAPAILDRLDTSSPFFSFFGAGDVHLAEASVSNLDADGLQLTGAGSVAISSVTFDFLGAGASTASYVTARDLASAAVFHNVAFQMTRSSAGAAAAYNVRVEGGDAGLAWVFQSATGAFAGPAFERDPGGRVRWPDGAAPGAVTGLTASPLPEGARLQFVAPGNDGAAGFFSGRWRVFHSTEAADLTGAVPSQAQTVAVGAGSPGSTQTVDVSGLALNALYHFIVWTEDDGPNLSPASSSVSAAPLLAPPQVLLAAGGSGAFLPLSVSFQASFDKPMQAGPTAGALRLRRVLDAEGNAVDEPVPGTAVADGAALVFTFTPGQALAGNSEYEFSVDSGALDQAGTPPAPVAPRRFVTLMDRTRRNVRSGLASGARVEFSPGALAADGYLASRAVDPAVAAVATDKRLVNSGDGFQRPLEDSLIALEVFDASEALQFGAFAAPVRLTLSYSDPDGDGVVDGGPLPVRARTLAVHWLDEARQFWVRLPSTVDEQARTVTAQAPHFSIFGLLGGADTNVGGAYAFPSPFAPAEGHTHVTFAELGQGATVHIHTASGDLVRRLTGDGLGQARWDGCNEDGRPVVSGVYIYRVSAGSSSKTGKLAVLR